MSILMRFISIATLLLFGLVSTADAQIQWLSWEEAQARNKKEPRKILVDVYTQWCGWCKKMDKATFGDPEISNYINQHYYAVKFDAETKTDINFKDRVFKYIRYGNSGYNQLADEIMFGKFSFPTIVFIDENLNVIQPIPGYQDIQSLDKIMKFFAEDYYKRMPWKKYEEMYIKGTMSGGDKGKE